MAYGLLTDSSSRKVKETGDVDSDGNSVELSDVEKEGDGEVGDESLTELRTTPNQRHRNVKIEGDVAIEGGLEPKVKTPTKRPPKKGAVAVEEGSETTATETDDIADGRAAEITANGTTAKPKASRKRTPKKAAMAVAEDIKTDGTEETGLKDGKIEETEAIAPDAKGKAPRKRPAKKIAEEVNDEIEARMPVQAEQAGDGGEQQSPQVSRENVALEVVSEVLKLIGSGITIGEEAVETLERAKVKPPIRRKGRPSKAKQLA